MTSLIGFSQHIDLLIELVADTASLIGFLFIFRALVKLKIYGEMRSMMAPHARVNQILLLLFAGTLLLYFPQAAKPLLVDAFFGSPVIKELPYHITQNTQEAALQLVIKRIINLLGHVALIRGIVQLGVYQEGGRNPLSKSLTHIAAGVCAINIQQTLDLLNNLVSVD